LLLIQGRKDWPEMAMEELEAGARLDAALRTGDIRGGSKALGDWIVARGTMYAMARVDGEP
jgi:hypothetical protein